MPQRQAQQVEEHSDGQREMQHRSQNIFATRQKVSRRNQKRSESWVVRTRPQTKTRKENQIMKNLDIQFKPTAGLLIPLLLAAFALVSLEYDARAQGSGNLENTLRAVLRAVQDIEAAETFSQVQMAIDRNETVWGDRSTVAVLNYILGNPSLNGDIRFRRQVERELALDYQRYGREGAARLVSVRILAVAVMRAQSVQEFAAVMERFSELADSLNPNLVKAALRPAAGNYPPALLSFMEQLGRDWPRYGALNAATRMARSIQQSGVVKRSQGGSDTSTFNRRYFEDRAAESIIKMGRQIPDGLIQNPVYP